ncbi:hypothetical protein [Comamonas composti]|uniref:hypothetical protein n=1 Tax=Comamonas composti TaxID=408558 RepID=UPI00146FBAFD
MQEKDAADNLYTAQRVEPSNISTDSYAYDGNGQLVQAGNQHIQLQWMGSAIPKTTFIGRSLRFQMPNTSTCIRVDGITTGILGISKTPISPARILRRKRKT